MLQTMISNPVVYLYILNTLPACAVGAKPLMLTLAYCPRYWKPNTNSCPNPTQLSTPSPLPEAHPPSSKPPRNTNIVLLLYCITPELSDAWSKDESDL